MKTKLPLIAALFCGLSTIGSAFTLDFSSVASGTTLPPALVINVPGYGDVQFDALSGSNLTVDSSLTFGTGTNALNFGTDEGVKITFLGVQPLDASISSVSASVGETFVFAAGANANEFILVLSGTPASNPGAGVSHVHFEAVPEPSISLLGLLGGTLLVIRRRR